MAFLNATSQFRKIVGKMVSYFEDEFSKLAVGGRKFHLRNELKILETVLERLTIRRTNTVVRESTLRALSSDPTYRSR